MIPAIIGLILTFIGTIVTSIGMVRERETGTLEQLAVMPIRPSQVILGKITPYFIVAAHRHGRSSPVLGMLLFDVPFNGNPFAFALGAALFLFVVLGLGVFISTISQNAGQAIQTAFFFLLPQILLSGMIFPLDAMAAGVRWIGYLLPLTYFTMISQGIMLRGATDRVAVAALHRARGHGRRGVRSAPRCGSAATSRRAPVGRRHRRRRGVRTSGRPIATTCGRRTDRRRRSTLRRRPSALDDVTVAVEPGQVVAVVGGDGAGQDHAAARHRRRGRAWTPGSVRRPGPAERSGTCRHGRQLAGADRRAEPGLRRRRLRADRGRPWRTAARELLDRAGLAERRGTGCPASCPAACGASSASAWP